MKHIWNSAEIKKHCTLFLVLIRVPMAYYPILSQSWISQSRMSQTSSSWLRTMAKTLATLLEAEVWSVSLCLNLTCYRNIFDNAWCPASLVPSLTLTIPRHIPKSQFKLGSTIFQPHSHALVPTHQSSLVIQSLTKWIALRIY